MDREYIGPSVIPIRPPCAMCDWFALGPLQVEGAIQAQRYYEECANCGNRQYVIPAERGDSASGEEV